jgi:hypothetical protein
VIRISILKNENKDIVGAHRSELALPQGSATVQLETFRLSKHFVFLNNSPVQVRHTMDGFVCLSRSSALKRLKWATFFKYFWQKLFFKRKYLQTLSHAQVSSTYMSTLCDPCCASKSTLYLSHVDYPRHTNYLEHSIIMVWSTEYILPFWAPRVSTRAPTKIKR